MAEGKKSFVLYCDLQHTIQHLDDKQSGKLFKHILAYVNDEDPETDDPVIKIVFEPIKQSLKRDLRKYEKRSEERSRSGKLGNLKRYYRDIYDKVFNEEISLEDGLILAESRRAIQSDTKLADNDSDSGSVSTNVDVYATTYRKIYNGYKSKIKDQRMWVEQFYMKYKLKTNSLSPLLDDFINHLLLEEKKHETIKEFKNHFSRWMDKIESLNKLDQYRKTKRVGSL